MKKYKIYYKGGSSIEKKITRQIEESDRNSRRTSRYRDNDFHIPDILRVRIINSYRNTLDPKVDLSSFDKMSQILATTNVPYPSRRRFEGIYYADDYIKNTGSSDLWTTITGLSNSYYWNLATHDCFFKIKDGIKPSDALESFFCGPTFADCANVIQASIYQLIQNKIGKPMFDKIFGNPISQFLITKYLYNNFESTNKENPMGNPLYFLFDIIETDDLSQLQNEDILHIAGIREYTMKHLCGFAPGWNLICVKEKQEDEPKYMGFGPDSFAEGPITYEDLRQIFIRYYNEPHSKETLDKIRIFSKKLGKGISSVGLSEEDSLTKVKLELSQMLANDVKPETEPIQGLKFILRFNQDKLRNFIEFAERDDIWYKRPIDINPVTSIGKVVKMAKISQENKLSTFENYQVDNQERQNLLDTMLKFAISVSQEDGPKGLIISGKAGIGKTHLSIGLLKYVFIRNKNVLYVDESYIKDQYQKKAQFPDFKLWFTGIDLIILDDLNSIYGSGSTFFRESIDYCFKNNKSILVSSNSHLDMLYDCIPFYIGYNNPIASNFLILNDIQAPSYRKPWSNPLYQLSNEKKIVKLAEYSGNSAAAIVLFTSDVTQQYIYNLVDQYSELVEKKPNVRIALEPYRNQRVFDLYMHDIEEFDLFVIKVTNRSEGEQLVHLIENIHDKADKLIVLSEDKESFTSYINSYIHSSLNDKYLIRRLDRLRIIFPGYW
jgi:hypothetical protein